MFATRNKGHRYARSDRTLCSVGAHRFDRRGGCASATSREARAKAWIRKDLFALPGTRGRGKRLFFKRVVVVVSWPLLAWRIGRSAGFDRQCDQRYGGSVFDGRGKHVDHGSAGWRCLKCRPFSLVEPPAVDNDTGSSAGSASVFGHLPKPEDHMATRNSANILEEIYQETRKQETTWKLNQTPTNSTRCNPNVF